MIDGDPAGDQARAGVTGQHRPIDLEFIQELDRITREVDDSIIALGLVGVAMAAL